MGKLLDTPFLIAALTASVTLAGWLVNHVLSARRDRNNQRLGTALKYVERQLEELYGPLAFHIVEGRRAAQDFVEALGREPVFEGAGALSEDEVKLWLFWVEHDFMPRNEKIQQLLMTKAHLIEGDQVPVSFVEYLQYYNSWRMSHLYWKKEEVKYMWRSKASWPASFTEEALRTFKELKARHNRLAKKMHR